MVTVVLVTMEIKYAYCSAVLHDAGMPCRLQIRLKARLEVCEDKKRMVKGFENLEGRQQHSLWMNLKRQIAREKWLYQLYRTIQSVFAENALRSLLEALTSPPYAPMQHLEREQALAKQFAEILHFTLSFDELKVSVSHTLLTLISRGMSSAKIFRSALSQDSHIEVLRESRWVQCLNGNSVSWSVSKVHPWELTSRK